MSKTERAALLAKRDELRALMATGTSVDLTGDLARVERDLGGSGASRPCETCADYGIDTLTRRTAVVRFRSGALEPSAPYPLCRGCLEQLMAYPMAAPSCGETGDVYLDAETYR